jgi:hypothetical protein
MSIELKGLAHFFVRVRIHCCQGQLCGLEIWQNRLKDKVMRLLGKDYILLNQSLKSDPGFHLGHDGGGRLMTRAFGFSSRFLSSQNTAKVGLVLSET